MDEDQIQDESAAIYKAVADAVFKILAALAGAFVAALCIYVAATW